MTSTQIRHRLAALMAADVAGYSRLMSLDEGGTIGALDSARAIFRSHIERHGGRVVDMAGDSVLAIFETALGAVTAAIEVQAELNSAAESKQGDRSMRFRIGVHLGDVVEKADGSVYGDGVNIAARLQSSAEEGGISVSEPIRTTVKNKLAARFVDLGEQMVKNISEPVRIFRLYSVSDLGSVQTPSSAAAIGADVDASVPNRPSIAVLPFTNMSADPEQEHFADGITEDIITELSRFESVFVIATNSSFSYKGKQGIDVRSVSRELGVRYVVEGSIRRLVNRVRVTGQLIDSSTGTHVWAEKYDRVLDDIFSVQDELVGCIVGAIAPQVDAAEMLRARHRPNHLSQERRPPANASAYELALAGWSILRKHDAPDDRARRESARRLALEALKLDPRSSLAARTFAWSAFGDLFVENTPETVSRAEDAIKLLTQIAAVDPMDHHAFHFRGVLLFFLGQWERGIDDLRLAHHLNPNDVATLAYLGYFEAVCGDPERGVNLAEAALIRSPRDPQRYLLHTHAAACQFISGDEAGALAHARKAVADSPWFAAPWLWTALCAQALGQQESAAEAVRVLRRVAPSYLDRKLGGEWPGTFDAYKVRATRLLREAARSSAQSI